MQTARRVGFCEVGVDGLAVDEVADAAPFGDDVDAGVGALAAELGEDGGGHAVLVEEVGLDLGGLGVPDGVAVELGGLAHEHGGPVDGAGGGEDGAVGERPGAALHEGADVGDGRGVGLAEAVGAPAVARHEDDVADFGRGLGGEEAEREGAERQQGEESSHGVISFQE